MSARIACGPLAAERPYAAPPVGDLRWQPPQPVARWKRILFAHDFGNRCIQSGSGGYSPCSLTFLDFACRLSIRPPP